MNAKKSAWTKFTHWFTIIVGSIFILVALFNLFTQWRFISVSTEGVTVKELYQGPNDIIICRLNVPEGRYSSGWEWSIQDDGSIYQIPKRAILELYKNTQDTQLIYYQMHDNGEINSVQAKTGGPAVTSWYIGSPNDSVFIWSDDMDLQPAPEDVLRKVGLLFLVENENSNAEIGNPWTEWDSIEEAELATGFSFGLPTIIADSYKAAEIRTMNNELIEVIYRDDNFEVCVRKQKGEGQDVSGDYNEYETSNETNYNGGIITNYHNSSNNASKQIISYKGFSWSLVAPNGFWGDSNYDFVSKIWEQ